MAKRSRRSNTEQDKFFNSQTVDLGVGNVYFPKLKVRKIKSQY